MAYRHQIRVRYGEVDMQEVVFNAHYLAYCDDAVDTWFRNLFPDGYEAFGWDIMAKRAVIEWDSPARLKEIVEIDVGVERWGTTSFDVGLSATVAGRPVFRATITYVGVRWGTTEPLPAPREVRSALGGTSPKP